MAFQVERKTCTVVLSINFELHTVILYKLWNSYRGSVSIHAALIYTDRPEQYNVCIRCCFYLTLIIKRTKNAYFDKTLTLIIPPNNQAGYV